MSVSSKKGRPRSRATGKDLGDEYLIYDPSGDRVHVLNGTAREILLRCDGSRTEEELADGLVEEYGIDRETGTRDVERIIRQLSELGLLEWI